MIRRASRVIQRFEQCLLSCCITVFQPDADCNQIFAGMMAVKMSTGAFRPGRGAVWQGDRANTGSSNWNTLESKCSRDEHSKNREHRHYRYEGATKRRKLAHD